MRRHLMKKVKHNELTVMHVIILLTSNLLIGAGIALILSQFLLPYSLPLLLVGALILIPGLYLALRVEKKEDDTLHKIGK